jgi:ABC-2 type transport system ATP-binding protein
VSEALPEVPPVLVADRLGLRTPRGWVFRDVTASLPAGGVLSVHGPAGSGRSMLLLALAGRAALTTGALVVAGARGAAVRRQAAIAHIGGAVELEPELTVADAVRECRLLGGRPDLDAAAERLGLRARPADLVGELPAVEVLLLELALAASTGAALVVVDDVERGLAPAGRTRAAAAVAAVAADGTAVVTAGTDPFPGATATVALTRSDEG